MLVAEDRGYTLEANTIVDDEHGEVLSGGGTISRDQTVSVNDRWSLDRAVDAYSKSFISGVTDESLREALQELRQRWESAIETEQTSTE
ncbi:hypothetical protein HYW36_00600 [Candidatus Saccharibacteria bacterium]|nr:hypothetical protein [Candidatus Saccharibacteria bacterium]